MHVLLLPGENKNKPLIDPQSELYNLVMLIRDKLAIQYDGQLRFDALQRPLYVSIARGLISDKEAIKRFDELHRKQLFFRNNVWEVNCHKLLLNVGTIKDFGQVKLDVAIFNDSVPNNILDVVNDVFLHRSLETEHQSEYFVWDLSCTIL